MSDEDRAVINNRSGAADGSKDNIYQTAAGYRAPGEKFTAAPSGRWPANVLLDPDTAKALDQQSGNINGSGHKNVSTSNGHTGKIGPTGLKVSPARPGENTYSDKGGASRFFKVAEPDPPFMYAAKAPKRERPSYTAEGGQVVQHATVKPLSIMSWLVKLVTPPGGVVLDPFAGSGTTIEAALMEGFDPVGIEMETDYLPLIQHRIDRQSATLTA